MALCTAALNARACCIIKMKRFNMNPNMQQLQCTWVEGACCCCWGRAVICERGDLLFSVSLWKFKQCQQTDISLLWVIRCWEATWRQHPAFFTSFCGKRQKLASTRDRELAGVYRCSWGAKKLLWRPTDWALLMCSGLNFSLDLLSEISIP